ncbi:hypothetical protein EON62_04375, partial [archaeon]
MGVSAVVAALEWLVRYLMRVAAWLLGFALPAATPPTSSASIAAVDGACDKKKRVVVVGGSFGGLALCRHLPANSFDVTLVEPKQYVRASCACASLHTAPRSNSTGLASYEACPLRCAVLQVEYTPGILKAVVNPTVHATLHAPLQQCVPGHVSIVHGRVGGVHTALDDSADHDDVPTPVCASPCAAARGDALDASDAGGDTLAPSNDVHVTRSGGWVTVMVEGSGGVPSEQRVEFDYCVLATGSTYPGPCKAEPTAHDGRARATELVGFSNALKAARTVAVVGGGPSGVELASELAHTYPSQAITLVSATPSLLFGFPPALGQAAATWLQARGVQLLLGREVAQVHRTPSTLPTARAAELSSERTAPPAGPHVVFADGNVLHADVVVQCYGVQPNAGFLRSSPPLCGALARDGGVSVDAAFRLLTPAGAVDSIFAIGDVARHPFREPA